MAKVPESKLALAAAALLLAALAWAAISTRPAWVFLADRDRPLAERALREGAAVFNTTPAAYRRQTRPTVTRERDRICVVLLRRRRLHQLSVRRRLRLHFPDVIFTVYACRFRPHSARESDDGGQVRLEKLYSIIEECRYGIHDLSRTELEAVNGLPRFNMPLELGIFLGCKRYGGEAQRGKRLMILDVEQYRYRQFISDLAVHAHGGEPASALVETRDWLSNVSRRKLPGGPRLASIHAQFLADLARACHRTPHSGLPPLLACAAALRARPRLHS